MEYNLFVFAVNEGKNSGTYCSPTNSYTFFTRKNCFFDEVSSNLKFF